MMLTIPDLLRPDEIRQIREALDQAAWIDGRETAGHIARQAKDNRQLSQDDPLAAKLSDFLLARLGESQRFMAAALPYKVVPPRFNRYEGGGSYGDHVDSAVMGVPGSAHKIRTDISATLFLSEPDDYEGGELVVEDTYGSHRVKLPAGQLVLYPGTSLHHVAPVTRGARLAAFFWIQSMVRDDGRRSLLLELDNAIQAVSRDLPGSPTPARLSGVYNNLLRQWAET
ncbi:UNVERIFIED_CONTAM: PKHD-type hydroxylase [Trichonephila clavipes]